MKPYRLQRLFLASGIMFFLFAARAQEIEPYAAMHGGHFAGEKIPASPDPLISYRWVQPLQTDSLQLYTLAPVRINTSGYFIIPPVSRINIDPITVNGKGEIFFDFGVESAAWLEFESDDLQDTVEMSISEYNEPAVVNAGAQNAVKTKRPVKYGNVYRLELNDQLYEGVRFGWIHVKQFTRTWHIRNIKLVCQVHPVNYKGSFWCNDSLLNRIWYTGAYTVKLNQMGDYFGAILMERSDRQSWTGDAYPAQAAALVAFGNYDMIKKNLFFTSSQQNNGIPSYSLYWVLSLIDYTWYSGDTMSFNQLLLNADERLSMAYRQYDSLNYAGYMGWDERLGAGFENFHTPESLDTYRMLCLKTWTRFAFALRGAGGNRNKFLAKKYEKYVEEKSAAWEPDAWKRFNVHAVSEALGSKVIKGAGFQRYAAKLFKDRNNRLSYSPFNQYFIIQAMAGSGFYREALGSIRDCWGGQIQYGATSFFEVYRPSWNSILSPNDAPPNNQCGYTSLAHPWGAGVTQWLTSELLGVKPVEPGFKKFDILPHPANGITQVQGEVPTPFGIIKTSLDLLKGDFLVSFPSGTIAGRLGIPKAGREIETLSLNGTMIYRRGNTSGKYKKLSRDATFIYLRNLPAGNYVIKAVYENKSDLLKSATDQGNSEWKFPISEFRTDSLISGAWAGRYGKQGYVIFGYGKEQNPVILPAYIQSVTTRKDSVMIWDTTAADARALHLGSLSRASALVTRDPQPTWQTMTIDIRAKDDLEHKLSLYFLDYDRQQRRSAVEIFSLDNLNILAPVQLLSHYEDGKYLSFLFRGSIRIRINQVRGVNAAVSGLFFD